MPGLNCEGRLLRLAPARALLSIVLASAMPVLAGLPNPPYPASFWAIPASPGFALLGIAPNAVERPGTPTDLALSVLNSTQDLSILPRNYALEFAPYWLCAGSKITYADYAGNGIPSNLVQSASVSFATSSDQPAPAPESLLTSAALGFRASLKRGWIDTSFKDYAPKRRLLRLQLDSISRKLDSIRTGRRLADTTRSRLWHAFQLTHQEELKDSIRQRDSINDRAAEAEVYERKAQQLSRLRATVSGLETRRLGFKWDVAGGIAMGFPGRVVERGRLSRWGAWTTVGEDWPDWSVLGVIRLLQGTGDSAGNSADLGGRIVFPPLKELSISTEGVYRLLLQSKTSQWRAALTLSYPLLANKTVSFTFGRDFGGKQTGDLILLLNLLLGFGSERPIL
jgi:hypothetical protein